MSYKALVRAFSKTEDLPIPVEAVLAWIRQNTDHRDLRLYPVERQNKAFRGAFRRIGIPTGKAYSHEFDLICQVLYGGDLPDDWKRLVIVKEALHVFDPPEAQVNTPEAVRKLIPQVITPELKSAPFGPAIADYLGAYRAMPVLLPRAARRKLKKAYEEGTRTSAEIATYARLPDYYVGIWMDVADEVEFELVGF